MQYRRFGRAGFDVSALGFGLMRLPRLSREPGDIDSATATRMVHEAIDGGVNYLDTAYMYHNHNSELFAARALKGGYRNRVKLATKLPASKVETERDFDRFLDEQLKKLETDHIDVYLLHGLRADLWQKVRDLGVTEFLDRAKQDGRIVHTGFSFHDQAPAFTQIVDAYDWAMCLIQLNYMDHEYQAGVTGLRYAHGRGLAVAIMEPLRGGMLTSNIPDEVSRLWAESGRDWTPAEWALRWVFNLPEVAVVLSGMSTPEQLRENMAVASSAHPGCLSESDLAVIDNVRRAYRQRILVPCTQCEYCMPCAHGVDIPGVFHLYNNGGMFEAWETARFIYEYLATDKKDAGSCVECGECQKACPQGIVIPEVLREAGRRLATEAS